MDNYCTVNILQNTAGKRTKKKTDKINATAIGIIYVNFDRKVNSIVQRVYNYERMH